MYGNPTNSLVALYFDIRVKSRVRIRVRVRVRVRVTSPLRSILRVHRGLRVQVGLCYGYIYNNICHYGHLIEYHLTMGYVKPFHAV